MSDACTFLCGMGVGIAIGATLMRNAAFKMLDRMIDRVSENSKGVRNGVIDDKR